MAYATVARAITLYGQDAVVVGTDRDGDGTRDTGVFEAFLDVATNEINGYLTGRAPLPLSPVPLNVEIYCVDIAMYRARPTADVLTDEIKARYRAAIDWLKLVAAGKVRLVPDDATGVQIAPVPLQVETVLVESSGRKFTRESMEDL